MTKRKAKSAAEFLAEMNADPDQLKRKSAQEDARVLREVQIRTVTRPLLEALSAAGFPVASLDDLLPRHAPLSEPIVELLLESVTEIGDVAVQEQIVRALGAAAVPFPAAPLILLFRATCSDALRYAIANTIANADVRGANSWLLDAVKNSEFGTARQMLALAVARHVPPAQGNPVLVSLLDDMPGHAALALAESGQAAQLSELERRYETASGWEKRELGRAMSVIRRRLEER